jgi:alpha-L-fucosidase 2
MTRTRMLAFSAPAESWLHCLPLGNGSLGVMADGGLERAQFHLNHETGWSGSPASEERGAPDSDTAAQSLALARRQLREGRHADAEVSLATLQSRYSQAFVPCGTVTLKRHSAAGRDRDGHDGMTYQRQLDLATGTHEVRAGSLRERAVASAPHGVLLVESSHHADIEVSTPLMELGRIEDADTLTVLVRFPSDVPPVHEPSYPAASWDLTPGAALEGAIVVRRVPSGSEATVVLVAVETTYAGLGQGMEGDAHTAAERASAALDRAAAVGVEQLFADAGEDHRQYFERSSVSFHGGPEPVPELLDDRLARAFASGNDPLAVDPDLAGLLYDYGRYLLISSARPGGLPPTLQGIWNDQLRPPWSSNYTLNINAQMNHWACFTTDLAEMLEPLMDLTLALSEAGSRTAARLYSAPGWVAHHNTDAWLYSSPVGDGHGQARWSAWPMAAPWLVRTLWDAVDFGGGPQHAGRLWPVARAASEFALHWHRQEDDGTWVTSPATSPENAWMDVDGQPVALDTTTAMDLQLLADLFDVTATLAGQLGLTTDVVAVAARQRRALLRSDPSLTSDGCINEWSTERRDEDPLHRHVSHLYGLYPGTQEWSDQSRQAAVRTLEKRGDDSTGWSLVWKMCLWARLRRGDKVDDLLKLLFRDASATTGPEAGGLYPNLFAAHPPFQIDANLGFPAVVAECLAQSHGGGIDLLPALPDALGSGSAHGLVARPGVRLDLSWRDSELEWVTLQLRPGAPAGLVCRVRYCGCQLDVEIPSAGITLHASDFASER